MGKAKGPRKSRQNKKQSGLVLDDDYGVTATKTFKTPKTTALPIDKEKSVRQAKRNKGSRNKKQNVRKIDITEVEQQMEDERHDERTGGSAAVKGDDQLFFIEKQGDATKAQPKLSRKERARAKVLHSVKALEPNPHIKVYKSQKAKSVAHLDSDAEMVEYVPPQPYRPVLKATRKRRKTDEPEREAPIQINSSLECTTELPPVVTGKIEGAAELWERPEEAPTDVDLNTFLEAEKMRRVKIQPKSNDYTKPEPSSIQAVEIPEVGLSYNPTFKGHQELLAKVLVGEMSKIQNNEELDAKLPKKLTQAERSEILYNEMSVGFADDVNTDDSDSDDDGDVDDEGVVSKKKVAAENRKTRAQKNKAEKHQKRVAAAKAAKQTRLIENEIFRLKGIKKEIKAFDGEKEKRQEVKQTKNVEALAKPKKLSRRKFIEAKPAFKLTEELTGNLRDNQPEGNPLSERFKNLQKRNIVEVRTKSKMKRRYRLKEYQKRSYKNYDLEQELTKERNEKVAAKKAAKAAAESLTNPHSNNEMTLMDIGTA